MRRLRPFLPAIMIFCLGLLVRIVYNLVVAADYYPLHDSLTYQTIAFNLLDEHCFCLKQGITISRAPLWPFLIAGLSLIAGRANIFARLFLCALDAGTCVLVYLFVRDLFQNKRLALLAGLIACIYPALYLYTGWMYTETLYTFLQTAVCYCVLRIQQSEGQRRWLWVLCGVLLALLALTRPNGVVVIGLVVLWALFLVWRKRLPRRALLGVALTVLVACAVIAPWTIRNYNASHSFVLVAGGDGTVLRGAYNNIVMTNRLYLGSWYSPGKSEPPVGPPININPCLAPCEVLVQQEEVAAAIKWATSHPGELPLLWFYHLRNFFTPYTHEADMPIDRFPTRLPSHIVSAMSYAFPIPIMLLAALGLIVTRRNYWPELLFAYLVMLGTIGEILVFYGNARFRSPIEPLFIVLAMGAIQWLWQRWQQYQRRRQGQREQNEQPAELSAAAQ